LLVEQVWEKKEERWILYLESNWHDCSFERSPGLGNEVTVVGRTLARIRGIFFVLSSKRVIILVRGFSRVCALCDLSIVTRFGGDHTSSVTSSWYRQIILAFLDLLESRNGS
jgi:hypothetical protein